MGLKTNTMKKLILIFILFLIPWMLPAPGSAQCYIERAEPINYYSPLIRAMGIVETKLDTLAYNPLEEATGFFQIRPIRLEDYNMRTGKNYTLDQMYDYKIAESIFLYYTKSRSYEKVAKSWNGSGNQTLAYWKKVKKELI